MTELIDPFRMWYLKLDEKLTIDAGPINVKYNQYQRYPSPKEQLPKNVTGSF